MLELIEKLFSKDITSCSFYNFPQKKDISDYKVAEEEFVSYFRRIKGVSAIYKFGGISAPGFSDLDIIVVFDNNYKHRYGTRYDLNFFSKKTQYILTHEQFFISKELMKNLHLLYDVSNLKKIWGKDITLEDYNPQEAELISILLLLDFCILVYLGKFLKSLFEKRFDVRGTINRLHGIIHNIQKLKSIAGFRYKEFDNDIEKIKELRTAWFDNKEEDNLKNLTFYLKNGLVVNYRQIADFNEYLGSNLNYDIAASFKSFEKIGFRCNGYTTYFVKKWAPETSLMQTVEAFLKTGKYVQFMPLNFCFALLGYAEFGGRFGSFINKQLFLKPDVYFNGIYPLLKKRADCLSKHIEFLEEKKIEAGVSFAPYGYKRKVKKLPGEYKYSNCKRWIQSLIE